MTAMIKTNWSERAADVLRGRSVTRAEALALLQSADDDLLGVLQAAFDIRRHYFGREVRLHVIQNARSGGCTEDCAYCSQSAVATGPAPAHDWKRLEELRAGARAAHECGALRYCVVASGRGPAAADVDAICDAVRRIKAETPIQICTSLGLLDETKARALRAAGVNRYNHNLETSPAHYPRICRTHTYEDRVSTIRAARNAGLEICSGGLLGMGETLDDRVDLAFALRELGVDSIPVNLLDPRPGTPMENLPRLRPADGLRALAMFRFVNPDREIRIAGGREACLGPLQALALYPANSMFTEGYLTTPGQGRTADMELLAAAGFTVGAWVAAD